MIKFWNWNYYKITEPLSRNISEELVHYNHKRPKIYLNTQFKSIDSDFVISNSKNIQSAYLNLIYTSYVTNYLPLFVTYWSLMKSSVCRIAFVYSLKKERLFFQPDCSRLAEGEEERNVYPYYSHARWNVYSYISGMYRPITKATNCNLSLSRGIICQMKAE